MRLAASLREVDPDQVDALLAVIARPDRAIE
jgi:hypothetical protein